jgi:hypothetical protein
MEVHLSERVGNLLLVLFLLILPWVAILVGLIFSLENVWYYLLSVTWFGCGLVFYGTLN